MKAANLFTYDRVIVDTITFCYNPAMTKQEKLDELGLKAWRSLITAHANVIGQIELALEQAEHIPLSSYDVLLALWEAPEHRLRMHELAERVILSRSGLSRLVDRLEKEDLLGRERTGSDRRGAYAVLTEKGEAAMRRAWPVYAAGINQHFASRLTESEMLVLTQALGRINRATLPN